MTWEECSNHHYSPETKETLYHLVCNTLVTQLASSGMHGHVYVAPRELPYRESSRAATDPHALHSSQHDGQTGLFSKRQYTHNIHCSVLVITSGLSVSISGIPVN